MIETICNCKGRFLKILIEGLPHLVVELRTIYGFQSWIHSKDWYCIEVYTTDKNILCEYDDRLLWEAILKLLDENLK